jgi:hypothetical protein
MLLVSFSYILVPDSNSVPWEHAILFPREWAYAAANHQNKRKRQLWSLISEKKAALASERTKLMRMMEII